MLEILIAGNFQKSTLRHQATNLGISEYSEQIKYLKYSNKYIIFMYREAQIII